MSSAYPRLFDVSRPEDLPLVLSLGQILPPLFAEVVNVGQIWAVACLSTAYLMKKRYKIWSKPSK